MIETWNGVELEGPETSSESPWGVVGVGPVTAAVRRMLAEGEFAGEVLISVAATASAATATLTEVRPEGDPRPLVLVTESLGPGELRAALGAQIVGIVLAAEIEFALLPCLEVVGVGQICVPNSQSGQVDPAALSTREKQILGLVVMGYMNGEIAAQLFIAESTVKSHLSSAFAKLGVKSRNEAVDLIVDSQNGLGIGILGIGGETIEPRGGGARDMSGQAAGAVKQGAGVGESASLLSANFVLAEDRNRGLGVSLRRDGFFRRSLLVADVVAFAAAVVAISLLSGRPLQLTPVGVFGAIALIGGGKIFGLYDRDEQLLRKSTLDEAPKLFQMATLGALCTWLAGGFVIAGGTLSRAQALLLWLLLIVFLVLARAMARAVALRFTPVERCLLIGDAAAAKTIRNKFCDHRGVKAELVAHLDPVDAHTWSTGAISVPRLTEIHALAHSLDVQRAIIASDCVDPDEMPDLICTLKAVGIKVSVLPRLLEVVGNSVEFDDLHGVTVMGVKRFALTRSSTRVKRAFDLCAATLGMVAVAPFMAVIALAIRFDSPGPVLFRQRRVGRGGHYFEVLKFRTMVDGADAMKEGLRQRNEAQDGLFKIADDPRITKVGRFLRKSSLDELPQVFNILRGEMSVVGPRPLVVDEDEQVRGWYRRRLELTPGMTGPWQILGPARVPLREMGAIDYLYVANWSLWGDFKILLRTVPHVMARNGL